LKFIKKKKKINEFMTNNNSDDNNHDSQSNNSDYETDSNRSNDANDGAALFERPARDLQDQMLKRYIRESEDINRHPYKAGLSKNSAEDMQSIAEWNQRNLDLKEELNRRVNSGSMQRPSSRSLSPEGDCTTCGSDSQSVAGSDSKSVAASDGKTVEGTHLQTVGAVSSGYPNPSAEGREGNSSKRKMEEEVSSPSSPNPSAEGREGNSSKRKMEEEVSSSSPNPSKRFKQDSSDVTRDETQMPEYGWGGDDDL